LRGELRVRTESGDASGLLQGSTVRLAPSRSDGQEEEESSEYEVESARAGRSGECRLRLRGIEDRDAAEALRGAHVFARSGELPELASGEYYAFELVGCQVTRVDGRPVGRVREIWETGASDLLVIERAEGPDALVPAVEPLLREVDVPGRRIVVDAPPGLLESDGDDGEETEDME
jgi:16S rRNA processing protein RimM